MGMKIMRSAFLSPLQRSRVRLQAHIGIALADYYLENYAEALQGFESALEEIEVDENLKDDGEKGNWKAEVSTFLAQVLWAMEGEDERDAARTQLLDW